MRRQDKSKNMERANMLFEERCKAGMHCYATRKGGLSGQEALDAKPKHIPLKGVGGQEGDATPKHAPKKHIPLKSVGGQEGDATPKKRLPLKQKVKEYGGGGLPYDTHYDGDDDGEDDGEDNSKILELISVFERLVVKYQSKAQDGKKEEGGIGVIYAFNNGVWQGLDLAISKLKKSIN